MNKIKILISFNLTDSYIEKIKDVSQNLIVEQTREEKELLHHIMDTEILFAGIFSRQMFLASRKLQWIQSVDAGVDKFLFPEIIRSPVTLTNAGGVAQIPISEHVIAILLSICRKLPLFIKNQMEKKWEYTQAEELNGKTAGIIGLGRIGKEIAKKIRSLGMKVIATKRNVSIPKPPYIDKIVHHENLKELLVESDFVILTVPLTKETEGMIGESQLRRMKKTGYLINVSRGKVVKEKSLIQALKKGWIAGAGLDTFENEPLSKNSELWNMDNVIITPHIAWSTPYYLERVTNLFCKNLKRFIQDKPLINVVDKKSGY